MRAVDLFAGAGGCSTGLLQAATKRGERVAVMRRLEQRPVRLLTAERLADVRPAGAEVCRNGRVGHALFTQRQDGLSSMLLPLLPTRALSNANEGAIGARGLDRQVGAHQHKEPSDLVQLSHAPVHLLSISRPGFAQRLDVAEAEALSNRVDDVEVGVDDRDLDADLAGLHINAALAIKHAAEPREELMLRPVREVVDTVVTARASALHGGILSAPYGAIPLSAGNKGDAIRQIGNAVDCAMAEALCGAILDAGKPTIVRREAVA